MTEPQRPENSPPPPDAAKAGESSGIAPPDPNAAGAAPKKLTPEEQMALYEEHLKETDWGHQPC